MASDPVPGAGGYTPVKDPQSPRMKELAEWAVADYNKKEGTHLRFVCILECESQIVEGVNYRFILKATDEKDNEGNYEAIVWEKTWEDFKELVYFKQLLLAES
ncbi:cysteine proteinase inhibitor 5-like [Cucumis melo]|uniref:Cysteine proteinase inhibitor 5-like n=1 Tax=Cucumis melo TaxID=3656 RepID=A0A1S3B2L7_CUCME|nr:cysteine proteinase inhibitor 5-like [Cucumis melo]